MLILYPNYSLEIVGNYLAFPFQVVLLVSFKSNLFWLKFLHYEVFNVLAFFKACPLLASFYIVSRISDFVKNFFQLFEALFLSISMRAIASLFVVFVPACLPDSLIILPKISTLVNAFFYLFLTFFLPFSLPPFPCLFQLFFDSSRWSFRPEKTKREVQNKSRQIKHTEKQIHTLCTEVIQQHPAEKLTTDGA